MRKFWRYNWIFLAFLGVLAQGWVDKTIHANFGGHEMEQLLSYHDPFSQPDSGFVLLPEEVEVASLKTSALFRYRRESPPNPGSSQSKGWKGNEDEVVRQVDISEAKFNETVKAKNVSSEFDDDHKYYKSSPTDYTASWVDLDELNRTSQIVKEHPMLSKSYRRAATVTLSFNFPFYGHDVNNITIATGGFLYTGQYVHSWLAATQYIAPLMANFDTSLDEKAKIRYADTGSFFVVEWANVYLQSQETLNNESTTKIEGPFTFQVILRKSGDIVFAYKSVPLVITTIKDEDHPVKVGLSDAYIIDRVVFFVRRKTIYEYHRVNLMNTEIGNETAIFFKALSTCNRKKSCQTCLTDSDSKQLDCQWCHILQQCSDGIDRNRQHWMKRGCNTNNLNTDEYSIEKCSIKSPVVITDNDESGENSKREFQNGRNNPYGDLDHDYPSREKLNNKPEGTSSLHVGIATIVIICLLFVSLFVWFGYAYFFPHTWSGQLLIKYRPTRWQWLRGEPRYTAASVHM